MVPNPLYHAILALGYIVGIVSIIFFGPYIPGVPQESIFYPMGMLALLVLSVTVMAYLFFYQPVTLLLDGRREEALRFFLKTIGSFAVLTAALFCIAVFVVGRYA